MFGRRTAKKSEPPVVEEPEARVDGKGRPTPKRSEAEKARKKRMTPPRDRKQAAALVETWEAAGFKVTLDPLGDIYYSEIQKPSNKADVMWGGWGADWPSAMTVTAALFDSRQIEKNTNGQNYGNYKNPKVDGLFDKAGSAATIEEQNKYLQEADAVMGEDVAYIPLEIAIFNWVYGSKVKNFTTTGASSSFVELGSIDIED